MIPILRTLLLSLVTLGLGITQLFAHATGENYVFVEFHETAISGRFEFRIDELKEKLDIDIMVDGVPSADLLKQNAAKAHAYIRNGFSIGPEERPAYVINFTETSIFDLEGGWAQLHFTIPSGPVPAKLEVEHTMAYENDPLHRGVLIIEKGVWPSPDYKMHIAMVFSQNNPVQILDTQNPATVMTPMSMIWQGVLHIWIGIDHILFLLALALPVVLVKNGETWSPSPSLKKSLGSLVKIITVFTIAHSITLLLASLDIVTVPSRLVESVIALSIILVGLNNILGRSQRTSLIVILTLGLFHGLGFASVMGDLPFRIAEIRPFILMILGFNLGVEIGQLAILVIVFPLLFALRSTGFYRPVIVKGGSAILSLVAIYWFIERAFAL